MSVNNNITCNYIHYEYQYKYKSCTLVAVCMNKYQYKYMSCTLFVWTYSDPFIVYIIYNLNGTMDII